MTRLLKWLLVAGLAIAVVAGAGLLYFHTAFPAVPPPETVEVAATPDRLARGEYLFDHVSVCVDCHSTRDYSKYAAPVVPGTEGQGGEVFDEAMGLPGRLVASNITPAGVGDWSDGELLHAVTTGVTPDGKALFPLMPYHRYGGLSRDDAEAIVAYMRTLRPIPNEVPERSLHFPVSLLVRTMPQPAHFVERPAPADRVAYGGYLTNAAACADCHTPADGQGTPLPGMDFAGGMPFRFPWGSVVHSANLTPDADTGLGTWTEAQFVDKFKAFDHAASVTLTEADRASQTVMPWAAYAGMTREDLGAIYAFLRAQKPIVNRVPRVGLPAGAGAP